MGLQWGTTSFTYDGNAHVPTATATGLVGSDVCNVTVDGAQTNAGSYTATASALSNANYKLPAATTTTFTIAKAASAVATAPTAKALTYTGSAQELVTAGTATGGTMQYSLDASAVLTIFIDNAFMANLTQVRIIHGKGTGILRKTVHEELRRNKHVKSFRLGVYGEGEDGVTIATLK